MTVERMAQLADAVRQIMAKPMKAKAAFRLSVGTKPLREQFNLYESARQDLFKRFGEPAENGMVKIRAESIDDFRKEMEDLARDDVEVADFRINLSDIEDIDIPGSVIETLAEYIVDTRKEGA